MEINDKYHYVWVQFEPVRLSLYSLIVQDSLWLNGNSKDHLNIIVSMIKSFFTPDKSPLSLHIMCLNPLALYDRQSESYAEAGVIMSLSPINLD